MNPVRSAILLGFMITIVAWAPLGVQAGSQPYVVVSADLAIQSLNVAISSRQLTLIHFDTGDVSMVAVGDPTLVNVTVKGPDVLVRALAPSGSTNAFIWQATRYTQWTFTVRQNGQDARLIIVRDSAAARRDESTSAEVTRGKADSKNAPGPVPVDAATDASRADAAENALATTPQPAAEPARQATHLPAVTGDLPGGSLSLEQFLKTLSADQREAFLQFVTEPTLTRLQPLLRELNAQQRRDLLELLIAASSSHPTTAGSRESTGAVAESSPEGSHRSRRATAEPSDSRGERDKHEDRSPTLPKPTDPNGPEWPSRQ